MELTKAFIPIDEILDKTSGGLDIIKYYYPNADEKNNFAIRKETAASTSLKKDGNIWFLKDFGTDSKRKNAVEIVMENENLDFHKALLFCNEKFCNGNIVNIEFQKAIPDIEVIPAKDTVEFVFNENLSEAELSFLGTDITNDICKKYNVKSVKYYDTTKGKRIKSNEKYFIFCYDFGTWKKLYQPFTQNKEYKYLHFGKRPENFIFGYEQLKNEYYNLRKNAQKRIIQELEDNNDIDKITQEEIEKKTDKELESDLRDLIICAGEKDTLNAIAMGYNAISMNSETSILKKEQFDELKKMSKEVFNIPDIDKTGIKQGFKLALQYIDIITIWLDKELLTKKDYQGKSCKDLTDFIKTFSVQYFQKIKNTSTPLRFWEKTCDTKGNFKGYILNNTAFYNFLIANGFYKYEDKNNKYGYCYVKIENNIVERIEPENIKTTVKDFVNKYLEKYYYPVELRNMFYKSKQAEETSLANLPYITDLDFKTYGKDFDYFFFNNCVWKITKDEITEIKYSDINKNIWKSEIKNKCSFVKKTHAPIFKIDYTNEYQNNNNIDILDKYKIQINDNEFNFMRYLINTSRMYWKKTELTDTEKKEEQLHLINKIYSLGYLMHKYKNPSKAWLVWAMDSRDSDLGKSFGGSGKSICYKSIQYINNNMFFIKGRNPKITQNDFIYDGVNEFTKNILIDDAINNLDFGFFFSEITGHFSINPKNNKPFTLEFEDSPKLTVTTNFALKNSDPSTERRILYTAFSDYYHKKDSDGEYSDTRTPDMEFGKNLFTDFTEIEWNKFYNIMALCLQTFLKFEEKIEPPMMNIEKRNLKSSIGSLFDWFTDYFSDNDNLNNDIVKNEMIKQCVTATSYKNLTSTKFKDKLQAYCKYRSWILNPEFMLTDVKNKRITKTIDYKTCEVFHIYTKSSDNLIPDEMPF
jgi:hypothetical protein